MEFAQSVFSSLRKAKLPLFPGKFGDVHTLPTGTWHEIATKNYV
jgi:hypothetical protein